MVWRKKNFKSRQQGQNSLARLVLMHQIVVHPIHYANPCIGYQSSNVSSINDVQSSTTSAAILPSPTHWSARPVRSLRSSNSVLLAVPSTKTATELGFLRLRPSCLNSLPSEKHHHNLNVCTEWKDIFFNPFLRLTVATRRFCIVAVTGMNLLPISKSSDLLIVIHDKW